MALIVKTILVIVLICAVQVNAIVFTRCVLAKALLTNGMPRNRLEDWVCLVEAESSRNTAALGGPNQDGSFDYGLFQINNRYWCTVGMRGGGCNIDCNKLLDDDISDDSKCAQHIYKQHNGFSAWNGWLAKCQGNLPDLSPCGL